MRFVASIVTVLALLAHAILGCCSHHVHAVTPSSEAVAAVECCHEHDCHESEPSDGDHQEQAPCNEADCSFASGGVRLTVESPLLGLALPAVDLALRPAESTGQMARGDVGVQRLPGASIYILHQRLVI